MNNNDKILKLVLLMAFADKVYMAEEKELINDLSNKLKISKEKLDEIVREVEKVENITEECRKISKKIQVKEDKEKTIKLLSEMVATDKIVHQKELFAFQIIAEEWDMFVDQD